jgi:outer membrane protein TolC
MDRGASHLLVLLCAAAMTGCHSGTGDRPLLPLLGVEPPTEVNCAASFGTPVVLETTPALIQAGSIQKSDEKHDHAPKWTSAIAACFAREQTIDLQDALRLANIDNPTIGISAEVVRANLAERMLARSLLFPTLNLGTTVSLHQGSLLSSGGIIRDVERDSLYLGAGADVRGAGTVAVPGVQIAAHLGDAVFAPRIAQQKVMSSQFDAAATRNNVLLDVATTYLALVSAEARLLAYRQSESEYAEMARLTRNFADEGQGLESDAQRARSELMLLQNAAQQVEEDVALWATELSRLLSIDPSIRLRPEFGTPPLIQLVDGKMPLEVLIETAIAQRPEVAARNFDVDRNQTRLRQERVRPFVPTLLVGYSAGDFGGGSDLVGYRFSRFNNRSDFDVMAVWTLQNMGAGNRALQNQVRAQIGQAEARRSQMIDQVRTEVAEALAQTNASRLKMDIAKRRVETSQQGYRLDLERARNNKGHFIEVLNSLNLLTAARQDLVLAMVGYSQSQFQLYVALGGMPEAPPRGEGAGRAD